MFAADPGVTLAFLHRPSAGALVVAFVCATGGWMLHLYAAWSTRTRSGPPGPAERPTPLDGVQLETPAVVALLTNGGAAPRSAVTATALDLASRGWIQLTVADGELVVITRAGAATGDALRPYEQQVLNHLSSRAFNGVTSATTLAQSHHRLDQRWWLRFWRAVAAHAHELGLSTRRYTPLELVPSALAGVFGLVVAWRAARGGERIALADSVAPRAAWLIAVVALAALGWRTVLRAVGPDQRLTEPGATRAAAWMGYRSRLRDRIPLGAGVLATPVQQRALAHATVMGVAEQVLDQFPVAPEDHRTAWSEAGGTPHVVRVHYPIRPGYGQHPLKVGAAGLVVFLAARWARGFLIRVSDGDALRSLLDRAPGQSDLIGGIAEVLAVVCWIPIIWGGWAIVAGVVDSLATRERLGFVVRARRPGEVLPPLVAQIFKPFAERDRFTTYLAVDDGRRTWLAAWLASERSSAPQGAQARVRATPLLGYVRSSEPVGTATRSQA